jgi:hypothetical protein
MDGLGVGSEAAGECQHGEHRLLAEHLEVVEIAVYLVPPSHLIDELGHRRQLGGLFER